MDGFYPKEPNQIGLLLKDVFKRQLCQKYDDNTQCVTALLIAFQIPDYNYESWNMAITLAISSVLLCFRVIYKWPSVVAYTQGHHQQK